MQIAERMTRIGIESAFEVLQRARALEAQGKHVIHLEIGQPDFPTPAHIKEAAKRALDEGWTGYGPTPGFPDFREAIADYISTSRGIRVSGQNVVVVPGGKPIMFFAMMAVVEPGDEVIYPNPGFPIYESVINFLGATPVPVPLVESRGFSFDLDTFEAKLSPKTKMVILNSPGNPTGAVMPLDDWAKLFALQDRYGFTIASDECYSEIYFREEPPLGGLEAAAKLGRGDFRKLVAFTSLSKRSNVPGMRSGFVAGDAAILKQFLLYRTYHGSAMSGTVAAASIAAWSDELHVVDNRAQYRAKFAAVTPLLEPVLDVRLPDASFYLWAGIPPAWQGDDAAFARALYAQYNVTVLPGSYLAREVGGANPGRGRIRMALVADTAECTEAAQRIVNFIQN